MFMMSDKQCQLVQFHYLDASSPKSQTKFTVKQDVLWTDKTKENETNFRYVM